KAMSSRGLKRLQAVTGGCGSLASLCGLLCSRTGGYGAVGRVEDVGVAQRCVDAEVEQFADSADGAAGGPDLVEDSVFAHRLCGEADLAPGEGSADGGAPGRGAPVDEQVRVDRVRPRGGAVVEPGGEPRKHGAGEGDGAPVDGESSVDDVGE